MASSSRILGHGAGHLTGDDGHSSSIGSISSSSRKRKFDLDPTESSQHKDTEPFKMLQVGEVFRNFHGEKAEIVKHLKFTGLTMLPKCKPGRGSFLKRNFSIWLMNNVDIEGRALDLGPRGRIPITAEDVQRVLGLPCQGQDILPFNNDGMEHTIEGIKNLLLLESSDNLDMEAIESIVLRKYPLEMCTRHRISFLVAVVIYAVSYFLAPTGSPPKLNYDVLPYLNEPVSAFCLNWSQYVLDILMESCKKVQSAKYWTDKEKCTLDGCLIFLQIIYLDNLDFGSSKTRQFSRPRVADFSCTVFDKLISLDTDITSTNDNFNFGITEMRHPRECIYTHAKRLFKMLHVGGKKKIREMCNQFSVKLCKQVDISQHTFMKIAKDWFISRKRRIIADIKCLQKEGSQMDKDASDGSYSSHTSDTDDDSVETEEDLETLLQLYSTGESTVLKTNVEGFTGTSPPLVPIAAIEVTPEPDDGNKTPIVNFLHIDYGHRVDESMKDVSNSATPDQPGNVHNATGK